MIRSDGGLTTTTTTQLGRDPRVVSSGPTLAGTLNTADASSSCKLSLPGRSIAAPIGAPESTADGGYVHPRLTRSYYVFSVLF